MRWWRLLPILPALAGAAFWVNGYVAKTADVTRLQMKMEEIAHELRVGQLENQLTGLRTEKFLLESVATPTPLEKKRRFDVDNELRDVEQTLKLLRQVRP